MILCIETSASVSSVALHDGQQCWFRQADSENFQAEHILAIIDAILNDAGLKGVDLDALAVSVGPGRFTGLRVGVAVAQGLAFAWGKRMIAIDSLAVLAERIHRCYGEEKVIVMTDARRDEVYRHSFIWNGEIMVSQQDLAMISFKKVQPFSAEWVGAGSGLTQYPILAKAMNKCYISPADQLPSAQDMLSLAAKAYSDNQAVNPEQILPNYLREEVVLA